MNQRKVGGIGVRAAEGREMNSEQLQVYGAVKAEPTKGMQRISIPRLS